MSFRAVLAVFALVTVAGVGVGVYKGWDELSGVVEKAQAKQEICATLTDTQRLELVGTATPKKLLNVGGAMDPYTCRWATADSSQPLFVEALSVSADVWAAQQRPAFISQSQGRAMSPKGQRLLKLARQGDTTAVESCRFAGLMFEMSGGRPGTDRLVAPVPQGSGPAPAMLAQSCVDGVYTAVLAQAPGLKLDKALVRRTAQALTTVEERML